VREGGREGGRKGRKEGGRIGNCPIEERRERGREGGREGREGRATHVLGLLLFGGSEFLEGVAVEDGGLVVPRKEWREGGREGRRKGEERERCGARWEERAKKL
jgi:hypothetical protein